MHLPNEFLNNSVASGTAVATVGAVVMALRKVRSAFLRKIPVLKMKLATFPAMDGGTTMGWRRELTAKGKEKLWRMTSTGMFVFAAQLFDFFPVKGGAPEHLLGGVLAALVVGPWEALLVMSAVLGVQAILLGDGGVWALGANILNMGVIASLGGYGVFRFLIIGKMTRTKFLWSAGVAAWISVIAAAVGVAVEMAGSGTAALGQILPEMVLNYTLVGVCEGMITAAILALLLKRQYPVSALPSKQGNAADTEESLPFEA
jgi:cobalt/nickel transport system permease protein